MKKLLILRHAKSSWKQADMSDHDRPLNSRGKQDAPHVGRWLKQAGIQPDRILCSTAKRARKTTEKLADELPQEVSTEFLPELYLAPPEVYLEFLKVLPGEVRCAMVVGHNPGLEDLVAAITGEYRTMKTAALAIVDLPIIDWSQLDRATEGRLETLVDDYPE